MGRQNTATSSCWRYSRKWIIKADLPMPVSPSTSRLWRNPNETRASASRNWRSSASRPIRLGGNASRLEDSTPSTSPRRWTRPSLLIRRGVKRDWRSNAGGKCWLALSDITSSLLCAAAIMANATCVTSPNGSIDCRSGNQITRPLSSPAVSVNRGGKSSPSHTLSSSRFKPCRQCSNSATSSAN